MRHLEVALDTLLDGLLEDLSHALLEVLTPPTF
jgi:hypothetical protein